MSDVAATKRTKLLFTAPETTPAWAGAHSEFPCPFKFQLRLKIPLGPVKCNSQFFWGAAIEFLLPLHESLEVLKNCLKNKPTTRAHAAKGLVHKATKRHEAATREVHNSPGATTRAHPATGFAHNETKWRPRIGVCTAPQKGRSPRQD